LLSSRDNQRAGGRLPGSCSIELELKLKLKLGVVAPALSGAKLEGDYPPVLAYEDGLEVAIEQLSR
jgi:hypothetical protein